VKKSECNFFSKAKLQTLYCMCEASSRRALAWLKKQHKQNQM